MQSNEALQPAAQFGEPYVNQIQEDYGDTIASQITDWKSAQLDYTPDETIEYVRLRKDDADTATRPVLLVPGFMAGIVANAPFGAELAHRGFDVIVPDQNRARVSGNVTTLQALNMAAIIKAENLQDTPLDIISHSYGSLITDELVQYAAVNGWTCFDDAKIAMLAPAGVADDSAHKFMPRWIKELNSGKTMPKPANSYWAHEGAMFVPAQNNAKANPVRAIREGIEVMRRKVDMSRLFANGIAEITLLPNGQDTLFPSTMYNDINMLQNNEHVTAASPVQFAPDVDGSVLGGRGASHSDQQFNPARPAAAIAQFFRN